MFDTYEKGYAAGKADALNYFPPSGSRLWKRAYRDGYSDGYHDHTGKVKSW